MAFAEVRFNFPAGQNILHHDKLVIEEAVTALAMTLALGEIPDVTYVQPRLTIKIKQDHDAANPRVDYDNVGVMFCKHRSYTLGDKDAEDPMVEEEVLDYFGHRMTENMHDDVWNGLLMRADEAEGEDCLWMAEAIRAVAAELYDMDKWETEHSVRDNIAICLPLYLYDHSGLTISHGSFSCQWDSGQVGWHYMTKEDLDKEFGGDIERGQACLEAELKIYDHCLTGNVWGFIVEDEAGNDVDSCWGFYGDDLEETGILDNIEVTEDGLSRDDIETAWGNRFD